MREPLVAEVMNVACMVTAERGEAQEFRTCEYVLNVSMASMRKHTYEPDIF
jgi:hypothetical protein